MNPLARHFSITRPIWLGAWLFASVLPAASHAAQPASGSATILPPDLVTRAREVQAYPTFCSIPPTPTDVRDAAAFRGAVAKARIAGANLARPSAPSTFSLQDTGDFAASAREEAAPPPPITTPDQADAEAFAKAARARATPPHRPR
ncbi:MAG: hypothetical protein ACR2FH_00530 [Caulobacteraceae bacterium]